MTEDQTKKILSDLAENTKMTKVIYKCMVGDPISGVPGFLQNHNRLVGDMYGIDPDGKPIEGKKNTIKERVSDLESNQKKVVWFVAGVVALYTAVKIGIAEFFGRLFEK
jgi:hypothetical protein